MGLKTRNLALGGITLCLLLLTLPVRADNLDVDILAELSLEELLAIEIVSVSDQAQKAHTKAAATFVINADDIRRSGRHTVPEVLRMAPGVHVGRVDSNKWAVGLRGFNGRFSNKFLVLLDGRSMYSRSLPGINWEQIDTVLPDIDRIEVIRGPGASLWGSNAVHGVINIVTKSAKDTQGKQLTLAAGTLLNGAVNFRTGGTLGEQSHYRVYAQHKNFSAFDDQNGVSQRDDWDRSLVGVRVDHQPDDRNQIRISAEVGQGEANEMLHSIDFNSLQTAITESDNETKSHHLLTHWSHRISQGNQFGIQLYYDHERRDTSLLDFKRSTFDFDFKQQIDLGKSNTLIWGAGYRISKDLLEDTPLLTATPNKRNVEVSQAFIQNEIQFTESLVALVGVKFEKTSFSDFEVQPSIKLSWDSSPAHHLWASVAKAVRTPSRAGTQVSISIPSLLLAPNTGVNLFSSSLLAQLVGNDELKSEEMIAYELGHRWQTDSIELDLALFYNDYHKLNGTQFGEFSCFPTNASLVGLSCPNGEQLITSPLIFNNSVGGHTSGGEISARWSPSSNFDTQLNVSHIDYALEFEANSNGFLSELAKQQNPKHLANVRFNYRPTPVLGMSAWIRYVSKIEGVDNLGPGFDSYTTLDLQLSWRLNKNTTVSISGLNLHDDGHMEFGSELGEVDSSPIERTFRGALEIRF